jgi:hypothetical protein
MCIALVLSLTCFQIAVAQPNYSSLFLANQNGTGATQTPLSLGNWNSPQTTVPSFTFNTSDNGTSFLDVHSTRWGSSVSFTRDDPNGSHPMMNLFGTNGQSALFSLYNTSAAVTIQLSAQGTTYFTGGAVAIGTTNPGSNQLAVQGTIASNKIIVTQQNPFPDFVFDPAYSLPTLDSLSGYIKHNHHLPDVPSAENVARNGIDLGSSQVVLLKKIEELTLYLIGQDAEIKKLKKQNRELEVRNQSLEELERRVRLLEKANARRSRAAHPED